MKWTWSSACSCEKCPIGLWNSRPETSVWLAIPKYFTSNLPLSAYGKCLLQTLYPVAEMADIFWMQAYGDCLHFTYVRLRHLEAGNLKDLSTSKLQNDVLRGAFGEKPMWVGVWRRIWFSFVPLGLVTILIKTKTQLQDDFAVRTKCVRFKLCKLQLRVLCQYTLYPCPSVLVE